MPYAIAYVNSAVPLVSGVGYSEGLSRLDRHIPSAPWSWTSRADIRWNIDRYSAACGSEGGRTISMRAIAASTQPLPRAQNTLCPSASRAGTYLQSRHQRFSVASNRPVSVQPFRQVVAPWFLRKE